MTTGEVERLARSAGMRITALDAFRGAAILLMVLDHVVLVSGGPEVIRHTVTRAAMPMFFLLAGYLASTPKWRHLWIGLLGLVLPVAVPFIDNPNVLVWWALGVVALWGLRSWSVPLWLPVAVALTAAANGWAGFPGSYDPRQLLALMCLGAMLPAAAFAWAAFLPRWVAAIGRHPLGWYVGHLLVLQGLVLAASRG